MLSFYGVHSMKQFYVLLHPSCSMCLQVTLISFLLMVLYHGTVHKSVAVSEACSVILLFFSAFSLLLYLRHYLTMTQIPHTFSQCLTSTQKIPHTLVSVIMETLL